ncbi:hypothetical protein BH23ACT2_BH23ACT2_26110 [soil metagenome]
MCHDDELNLKQVADSLGVHYMTVYRYVRGGRLPARREGNAWLVRGADLAAFTGTPLPGHHHAPTDHPGHDRHRDAAMVDWTGRLRARLVVGDESGAWATVEAALVSGWSPEEVLVDIVSPAVAATSAEDGPAAGHLATTTAQRTLAVLASRFRRRGRRRGTVVLGAPAGEGHAFALAVIADLLRLRNVAVLELGVAVPAEAFADAATRADRLIAVGIGVTSVAHLDAARDTIGAVRDVAPDVAILVGGQAVGNAEIAAVTGATAQAADARGVVDLVESLVPRSRARRRELAAAPTR